MVETQVKNDKSTRKVNPLTPSLGKGKPRRERDVSGYKKSLMEKQALKWLYNLSEKQFSNYVKQSLDKLGKVQNVSDELIKLLEKRLDNVVFRAGIAKTRPQARQLVSHGYFLVNGKSVNVPSLQLKIGDVVSFKESKKKKSVFGNLALSFKKIKAPGWIELDKEKIEIKIASYPNLSEVNPPVEIPLIFEFYSR